VRLPRRRPQRREGLDEYDDATTACTWAVPGQGVLLGVTSLKLIDHAI
jgi:hypothetical protein